MKDNNKIHFKNINNILQEYPKTHILISLVEVASANSASSVKVPS